MFCQKAVAGLEAPPKENSTELARDAGPICSLGGARCETGYHLLPSTNFRVLRSFGGPECQWGGRHPLKPKYRTSASGLS